MADAPTSPNAAAATVVRVVAAPLTAETWAPFGWLPADDTDPADTAAVHHFEWDDAHVNFIAHSFDEVEHGATDSVLCDVMYRHDTHTQTLMPLNVDALIAVAPAGVEFSEPGHFDAVRAFALRPLDAITLHRGTWHWGPFPTRDGPPVRLFNVQGKRYREDNASVDLRARGVRIEVSCPGTGDGAGGS